MMIKRSIITVLFMIDYISVSSANIFGSFSEDGVYSLFSSPTSFDSDLDSTHPIRSSSTFPSDSPSNMLSDISSYFPSRINSKITTSHPTSKTIHSIIAPSLLPSQSSLDYDLLTSYPTTTPSLLPSQTSLDYDLLTSYPTTTPSKYPYNSLSDEPSEFPSLSSLETIPTPHPSPLLSNTPTIPPQPVTFKAGDLSVRENGLILSRGLKSRIIAISNEHVRYKNGTFSKDSFHSQPDAAAVFPKDDGGWVYTSNSEISGKRGGVGALTFDSNGNVIDYKMILEGTSMNCGGGRTYWNTWVSCEEESGGQIYETDPFGKKPANKTAMGINSGRFESFAYDNRDKDNPRFFVTKDDPNGEIRRFTPDADVVRSGDYSKFLTTRGSLDYLALKPSEGTFYWSDSISRGKRSAKKYFNNVEGIDVRDGIMYFVSKVQKELFILDLDSLEYRKTSTKGGKFRGQPDQIKKIIDKNGNKLVIFTEDGGGDAGIHVLDASGKYYTILEGDKYSDETSGIALSPDSKHLYFSFQDEGLIFDVWREDGHEFTAEYLDIKYHRNKR